MAINKVEYFDETLIDLSGDTLSDAGQLAYGITAHGADGEALVGTLVEKKLQQKTVTSSTTTQTYNPDTGFDGFSSVTVNGISTATQATPTISVSAGGLITASATQSAGYVAAGTKSDTKQLSAQAAKTWTPTTSNQTIAVGTYITGVQTIAGDANLVGSNIISGKSIFGIDGTVVIQKYYTGSSAPSSSTGSNGDIYFQK